MIAALFQAQAKVCIADGAIPREIVLAQLSARRRHADGTVGCADVTGLRTGFGVIDSSAGTLRIVAQGCIATSGGPLADRLRVIHARVAELIALHCPTEIAIERVFLSKNADSALKLGQARGAALAAVPVTLGVHEYAPRAIKLAVVGIGGAEKTQVAHMVKQLLAIDLKLAADAADALAIAICHAHTRTYEMIA
jgi:crossover junction endodeoxyribonuclease RuvC